MTWPPAHLAVEQEDMPQLRDLLDAGHDVEDDDGHGWTLLRHAIDVEHDVHVQTGAPLHAESPRSSSPGAPTRCARATAELRGHWLAAEIMRAWTGRGRQPAGPEEGPR
jgi:hypothetical protein